MIAGCAAGELDAAVMWGPVGGPLAKAEGNELAVAPLLAKEGAPRMTYRITMGVRPADQEWKRELNRVIPEQQAEIDAPAPASACRWSTTWAPR